MTNFNLLEEPWIPCLPLARAGVQEISLRDVLLQSHEVREISDASPLVVVALHRLLLAVLHRVFGPATLGEWKSLRDGGSVPAGRIDAYLKSWHHRFDLFDPVRPFYQTSEIDLSYATGSIARLSHEAGPNNAQMFSHTDSPAYSPAKAARSLVAWLAFAAPGLVGFEEGDAKNRSASGAPLAPLAVSLVRGETLFDTLLMNLVRYNPHDEVPFATQGADLPAWEREDQPKPIQRLPAGYLDLLTWQSRRVRLLPEADGNGGTLVRLTAHMKGFQFPPGYERRGRETMAAFRRNEKAKPGQEPWPPLTLRPERAVWRDSLSLFQSTENVRKRPSTLGWLAALMESGALLPQQILPLDVFGLHWDQANVLFWRHERLPLPLAYLEEADLQARLTTALEVAEEIGAILRQATRRTARLVLSPDLAGEGREPPAEAVSDLANRLASARLYWSRLEARFSKFLVDQAEDTRSGANAEESAYGSGPLMTWARHARAAARESFQEAVSGLDQSGRNLKAVVEGERLLNNRMAQLWKKDELSERKEESIATV
jgi:CRISPR system Cascade subunit CasA